MLPFTVCIRCFTYNQSPYIIDALNGFVLQKTDFPFIAVIVDDASTDGTQEVIETYIDKHFIKSAENGFKKWRTEDANWTFARHDENQNCYFVAIYLKNNLFDDLHKKMGIIKDWIEAKYTAICEGDDYWIDSSKLQRQVDFLEKNEGYSTSTENGVIVYPSSDTTNLFSEEAERDVTFDELLIKRRFPTASVLFKSSAEWGMEKLKLPHFDTLQWAYLATKGKIHYNPIASSVYRRGPGVTSSNKIKWAYMVRSFNISLCKNFRVPKEIIKIRNEDVFVNIVNGTSEAISQAKWKDTIRLVFYGMMIHPYKMLKSFVSFLLITK